MKKLSVFLVMFALILPILLVEMPDSARAQGSHDVTLYLCGDTPTGDDAYFRTGIPQNSTPKSHSYGPMGGVAIIYILGTWETGPLEKDLHIQGELSVTVWLENDELGPARVLLTCTILINGEETGEVVESENFILDGSLEELSFSGHVDVQLNASDTFGVYITAKYTGTGFTFYWEGINHDSRIVVPADWVLTDIHPPVVDAFYERVTIETEVCHAIGIEEITDYTLQIEGPSAANAVDGPSLVPQGNAMLASWVWNYSEDDAETGTYIVTVSVVDTSGNEWVENGDFVISGEPTPPPAYNWTLIGRATYHTNDDRYPSLMIDNNSVFWMSFESDRAGDPDIWLQNSSDGINWNPPIQITTNSSPQIQSCLMQDSAGTYWLAWDSYDGGARHIWMSSSPNGWIWDEPFQPVSFEGYHTSPSLIQDSDGVYWLAWVNYRWDIEQHDIYISSSSDGTSWSSPVAVSSDHQWKEGATLIQDDLGMYRAAWSSHTPSTLSMELWISSSADGLNWAPGIQITDYANQSENPSMIQNASGGYEIIFESRITGYTEIWCLSSEDGLGWGQGEQVTNRTDSYAYYPSLVQDDKGTFWAAWVSSDGGEDIWVSNKITNEPPRALIYDITEEQSGDISFQYLLIDPDSHPCTIEPEYSTDGISFFPATGGTGGHGTSGLSSSPSGESHTYIWDSETDLKGIDGQVRFRITPHDFFVIGASDTTHAFHLDNNAPPAVEIATPTGENAGDVMINYTLVDDESDALSISAKYSRDGINYHHATRGDGGDEISGLTSSPAGIQHLFAWDSKADLGGVEDESVYFRITPSDADAGSTKTSGSFRLDNNDVPYVVIETPSEVLSGDIQINYKLLDNESDDCSITVDYSLDGTSYLPAAEGAGGAGITGLSSSASG
ncbi:MAG: exo-alpha-sialidase, partial [Thermoplasmata archaeon]